MKILFAATPKIALRTLETLYESEHDLVGVICAEEKRSGRGLKFVKSPIRVFAEEKKIKIFSYSCLLYTSPSPRDGLLSRMPSSA